MLIGMIGCQEKEAKTITNTVEGPKRCCRTMSSQGISGGTIYSSTYYWKGDQLDSVVGTNNQNNNVGVNIYTYRDNLTRESRNVSIIDGKRILFDGYALQTVDECGNILSAIAYEKDGKEQSRSTIVYKCD